MAGHPTRYADPTRCPDCWAPLDGPHCARCGLDLSHPDATELFGHFVRADEVLDRMRARTHAVAAPAATPAVQQTAAPTTAAHAPTAQTQAAAPAPAARADSGTPVPPGPPAVPAEPAPRPAPSEDRAPGPQDPTMPAAAPRGALAAASVPRILLGLGALCLLVAAVVFLALAWDRLGVGGRTAVLVGFTLTAAGLAWWCETRGLRWGAEAFTTVAFGLLLIDLIGADSSGWFGDLPDGALLVVIGGILTVPALAATYLTGRGRSAMLAPQLVAPAAASTLSVGLWVLADETSFPVVIGCLLAAGLGLLGPRLEARTMQVASWLAFGLWWLVLALVGFYRAVESPTVRGLWLELEAWPMLAAAAFLAVGAWRVSDSSLRAALGGTAITAVGFLLVLPALTGSVDRATLVLLLAGAALAVALWRSPAPWRHLTLVPLVSALAMPATAAAGTAIVHLTHAIAAVPLGSGWTDRLVVADTQVGELLNPLLLPVTAVVVVGALAAASVLTARPLGYLHALGPIAGLGAGLGVTAAVTAHPVPRVAAVAVALLVAIALTLPAVRPTPALGTAPLTNPAIGPATDLAADPAVDGGSKRNDALRTAYLLAASAAWLLTCLLALPSNELMLGISLALTGAGFWLAVAGRTPWQVALGECVVPAAACAAVASAARIVDLHGAWFGVAAIAVLGVLLQLRPGTTWLASHSVVGGLAVLIAVPFAGAADAPDSALVLALTLTLAGVAYVASGLLRSDRRLLALPGGAMLVAASWVWMWQQDVTLVEAYTLPPALALTALGAWRLYRDPALASHLALAPGLALGTVPSLLWVLGNSPLTMRGLLLGIACLALVLGGTRLRLASPLVVGSVVGAVLVVQFCWTVAEQLPVWAIIALAGGVLTGLGVTWERRVRDVRTAGAYLAALR